ncbi:MAG: hypothetical protein MUO58_09335 [Anaerolineales bacterium]|nr:hypothetical protein [Anaerolineales bacterium]
MDWLISGPPWVEYRSRVELNAEGESSPAVQSARARMIDHPQVQDILEELAAWPGPALKSHKSAGHLLHKLTFIADLGFRQGDPAVENVIERVFAIQSDDGPFQIMMNINPRYGGKGEDEWVWMLCDAPLTLYALVKFGLQDDSRIQTAAEHLSGLVRENGWPCAVSPKLGSFRGPGGKDDPCPYANLVMLKVLAEFDERQDSEETRRGVEAALTLWEKRRERHPYLFHMGTDFSKLKAPLIWYDILHVTDVLTRFPWARSDKRLLEMVGVIQVNADADGRFTPESIWTAWKGWDFGQKKEPSPWLTFLIWRMLKRMA